MAEPQQTGVPDGWEVVRPSAPPPKAPQSSQLAETRMPAGVPARGRGTQLNPDRYFQAIDAATTPLVQTGSPMVDSFTSPVGLTGLALGGAGIVRAGLAGGIGAGAKEALASASPIIKYEATKAALRAMHVPDAAASIIAAAAAGYKRPMNGKVVATPAALETTIAEAAPKVAAETPLELTRRVKAEYRAASGPPESVSASPAPAAGPPPSPTPAAPPPNALPDQRALNEAALAERRAAYQARQPVQGPAPKPKLTADEAKVYLELRAKRLTDAEARDLIQASRGVTALGGTMTNEQVAAEIAARIGNRSPKR